MTTNNSDNNSDDDDEIESFQSMMKGVKPLSSDKIDPDSAPKPSTKRRNTTTQKKVNSSFGELEYVEPVGSDDVLSFVRGGIQHKLMTKLKKGLIPFEFKIDLHGATVSQAGQELQSAINRAYAQNIRCVLVVHGRGKGSFDNKPALKTHVNYWLRDSAKVLAFHSAQPQHGGVGAMYVLLKRQRE